MTETATAAMERTMSTTKTATVRLRVPPQIFVMLLAAGLCSGLAGCSLFVMGGRMLMGDPKIPSAFDEFTHKSLAEPGTRTAVICTAPMGNSSEAAALDQEMQAEISRRLKQQEIDVIDSNKVASWVDDNGGDWGGPEQFFEEFDKADFLVVIDVNEFSYLERNSPNLYRGRANLEISVYENDEYLRKIYTNSIESEYPTQHPVFADNISESGFRKQYVDHLSSRIARMFYEHTQQETFD